MGSFKIKRMVRKNNGINMNKVLIIGSGHSALEYKKYENDNTDSALY